MKSADYDALEALYDVPGEFKANPFDTIYDDDEYPDTTCMFGMGSPIEELEFATRAGRPFFGGHGSHGGDYSAHVVAFDGEAFDEHTCDEDGELSIHGLLDSDPDAGLSRELDSSTWEFIAHYQKCRKLVLEG